MATDYEIIDEDTEHDMDMYLVKSQIIMILDMLKVLKQILV